MLHITFPPLPRPPLHPFPSCALNLRLMGDLRGVAKTRWQHLDTEAEWCDAKKHNMKAGHSSSVIAIAMPEENLAMLGLLDIGARRGPRPTADSLHIFNISEFIRWVGRVEQTVTGLRHCDTSAEQINVSDSSTHPWL